MDSLKRLHWTFLAMDWSSTLPDPLLRPTRSISARDISRVQV